VIVVNGAVMLPLYLMRAHALTWFAGMAAGILGTQLHHCGYRPWFVPSLECDVIDFHDYHHEHFVGNYGVGGWLDRLHGTDKGWRATLSARKRAMAARCISHAGSSSG
jgi:methylsterol monooxygenase